MAALQDCSVGLKVEATYGTAVVNDRFYEFTDESLTWEPKRVQGAGLRVGSVFDRSGRRVTPVSSAKGSLTTELVSKGFGQLWTAALGTGVSTLTTGTTYQQNFSVGSTPLSYTIQKGIVEAGGTVDTYTFTGCMVTGWEFALDNAGLVTLKTDWDARAMATATAYAAPTYPTTPTLYNFSHGITSAMSVGGAITAPTTTALATGGTVVTNVTDFKLKFDRGLNVDRYAIGSAGLKSKPTTGMVKASGSFTAEYDSTTNAAAFIADTELSINLVLTTAVSLSTGFEQFQIAIPAIKLDSAIPVSNKGDLITVSCDFTVLDGLVAAQPLYISMRTSDSAL